MAQLDVEQLTLEVQQIEATLNQLKNELARQKSLFKRKLGSSDALDRARFEHQSQQAQHKLAKLKLNYASIKAPIAGMVTQRMIKEGSLIRDNDTLFEVVDLTSLKAVLHLPEKELGNVKKQQTILLSVDALQGQLIVGQIERIRPLIDTDTGTFKVIAHIDNENQFLKSGMFGKVEVVFDVHQNSLLMQQQAVITQDNRSHVFVVKDNKALQTPVTLGFRHHGMVEIITGLVDDDLVITTGQQILKHESKIEVVGQPQAQIADQDDESATSATTATTAANR
ncbi:MAG: membrane fusion protein (multidrug efflux system) [Phenylobacterium sp.]|jgi:membrane fusion protein (multidrug efflux system)